MRFWFFLLGVLVGLAIAPARGRETWRLLRDRLATTIDAALRVGLGSSDRTLTRL